MSVLTFERTVTFCGPINDETTGLLIHALSSLNAYEDEKPLLILNSPGGNLDDGIALYDYIRTLPYKLTCHIFGQASSAASVMLQACDKRLIAENGAVMIHRGELSIPPTHPDDAERMLQAQNRLQEIMLQIYLKHCKLSEKDLKKALLFSSYFLGEEAVKAGLVDGVLANGTIKV
jgi:ATP-dependent protease ClpP protease subunit